MLTSSLLYHLTVWKSYMEFRQETEVPLTQFSKQFLLFSQCNALDVFDVTSSTTFYFAIDGTSIIWPLEIYIDLFMIYVDVFEIYVDLFEIYVDLFAIYVDIFEIYVDLWDICWRLWDILYVEVFEIYCMLTSKIYVDLFEIQYMLTSLNYTMMSFYVANRCVFVPKTQERSAMQGKTSTG